MLSHRSMPILVAVVVLTLCYGASTVSERIATTDDCRPVARHFNDELQTQHDQIVYDRKRFGESLDNNTGAKSKISSSHSNVIPFVRAPSGLQRTVVFIRYRASKLKHKTKLHAIKNVKLKTVFKFYRTRACRSAVWFEVLVFCS